MVIYWIVKFDSTLQISIFFLWLVQQAIKGNQVFLKLFRNNKTFHHYNYPGLGLTLAVCYSLYNMNNANELNIKLKNVL
jgi:hypothetical protein